MRGSAIPRAAYSLEYLPKDEAGRSALLSPAPLVSVAMCSRAVLEHEVFHNHRDAGFLEISLPH